MVPCGEHAIMQLRLATLSGPTFAHKQPALLTQRRLLSCTEVQADATRKAVEHDVQRRVHGASAAAAWSPVVSMPSCSSRHS
jgi:hypothetical protein